MDGMKVTRTSAENFAALDQKVDGTIADIHRLSGAFVDLDRKMDAGFDIINRKLDDRSRTPWAVVFAGLGVVLTFGSVIGTLAYLPVKADQARLEENVKRDHDENLSRDRRTFDLFYATQRQLDRLEGSLRPIR